jgi:hypothetical protein
VVTDEHTVGTAAQMSGVSVHTLHHYDQIGLVRPSSRSAAGYGSTPATIWPSCSGSCSIASGVSI